LPKQHQSRGVPLTDAKKMATEQEVIGSSRGGRDDRRVAAKEHAVKRRSGGARDRCRNRAKLFFARKTHK
jgi:hypothetical protein